MNTVLENKETKSFYNGDLVQALESCLNEGYDPLSMQKIVDARNEAPNDHELWQNWFLTPSIRATGRNRNGEPVVVYSHDSTLVTPSNLRTRQRIKGAMLLEQQEFYDLATGTQPEYVVDHEKLRKSRSGVIPVSKALKHPQTIPFLGGKERAEQYLKRHQEVFGNRIGVWHCDDLGDIPVARLLYLGGCGYDGLDGDSSLSDDGRFLGVRASEASRSGAAAQTLEQLLAQSKHFPTQKREAFEKDMQALFVKYAK